MTHVTCRLTAKNRDQLRNPTLCNRVWATFTFFIHYGHAAVIPIYSARKYEHTSPLLHELHWLKVPQRIQFRLCVLTYRCLNGSAPSYLAETIHPASSCAARHLRSADTSALLVPSTRRSTLGDRAFPAAAARAWNSLPAHVRNAPTLVAFRQELKTVLLGSVSL